MQLKDSYRLLDWINRAVSKGDAVSYRNLACLASEELHVKVSPAAVKAALSAAGIEVTVSRGSGAGALKRQVAELQKLAAAYEHVLLKLLSAGSFEEEFIWDMQNDHSLPAVILQVFKGLEMFDADGNEKPDSDG